MLYFFTPYSCEKKLLDAIIQCMSLLKPDDWAVIMDGDIAFLRADFGHQIQRHIQNHSQAGLFTCYASRCHYAIQVPPGVDMEKDSIRYHKTQAEIIGSLNYGEVSEINRRIAGHLMVIRKSTWDRILPIIRQSAANKHVLGVDTKISNAILAIGMKIYLMKDVYVFHYCRLADGFGYKEHLT